MEWGDGYPKIVSAAACIFLIYAAVYLLIAADSLLIPFVLAVLLWYLIKTIDQTFARIKIRGRRFPRWLRLVFAVAALTIALNIVAGIATAGVSGIREAAPQYQENLKKMMENLPYGFELEDLPVFSRISQEFNLAALMQRIARALAGLLGNMGLIAVYIVFLFLEERHFGEKIKNIAGGKGREEWIKNLLSDIDRDVKRYIGVKTLLSLVTALGAWVIMRLCGLQLAGFWALLIFILNFIPNLGSVAATILPSLMALVQFETWAPFFIILFGVGTLQFVIGNLLDPALMGKSLNVSPLVIILSLVFWGVIWGLPGMFLCVPMTVIIMIIFYNFETTRWITLLMSKDGRFKG